jgi:hypothetical protein
MKIFDFPDWPILIGFRQCARFFAVGTILALLTATVSASGSTVKPTAEVEPDYAIASHWWSELPNKWTTVGWRDHLYRFNVLYNGTLMNFPVRQNRAGTDLPSSQFTFFPYDNPDLQVPYMSLAGLAPSRDSGLVEQGWEEQVAPVLWSSWIGYRQTSTMAVMRQSVFAHITGGQPIKTGTEPLFAWVRLSVADNCPPLPEPKRIGFAIKINGGYLGEDMCKRYNIKYFTDRSKYPRKLHVNGSGYDKQTGFSLLEEGDKVRLAVPPGQNCEVYFKPGVPTEQDTTIVVLMDGKKGTKTDVLIPYFSYESAVVQKELALGYEGALAEANRFWSEVPGTAATFDVPETNITQTIRRSLQTQEMLGERDPGTGHYSMVTGGWTYGHGLWPTPVSMSWTMLMDAMGYHSVLEKYLEMFKQEQGTVIPPGGCFKSHPGYLSSPKTLTTIDWLTDHGAILNTLANHALLTDDPKYIAEWTPVIEKACDWIKYARRLENHDGLKGILPPAVANDVFGPEQAIWSDGWVYKGLTSSVKLLQRVHHPRANEFEKEAREYREVFRKNLMAVTEKQPRWPDASGKEHTLVPHILSGTNRYAWEGYLDIGPLTLVYAGLARADEPIMADTRAWFREGPTVKNHRRDADFTQPAILDHEMSSYEPCYSWNIFHSWQSGDRQRFLEGMYSLFAGAYSRQTYSVCEMRGGIAAAVHWLPSVYLARLAVIDDQIKEDELHLLRLTPAAWIREDRPARFLKIPTCYGPIDLTVQLVDKGRTLDIKFSGNYHHQPRRVIMHVPPLQGLSTTKVNGKSFRSNKEFEIPVSH